MKTKLAIAGVICMLLLAFYVEADQDELHHPSSLLLHAEEHVEEVVRMTGEDGEEMTKTFDYVYEGIKEVDGFAVELYQEYEITFDENGREVSREPTGNFQHVRYKK